MKHTTLYRRWRPRAFGEISGQEPIVRTLSRAIETGRVAHAYLFSGPRGTGKTSTAKVLAMGLNCERGPTPEPDGTCANCRAIINNSSVDVLEMDAASNRGIDEIRDLRDRVNLAPAAGRVKVYIIDEVHMLTAEAFNALLKMLEEPPEHVIFVLATTEKHKVLPTIISRCQAFDFRRPGVGTLVNKLQEIAKAEGIEAEPEALTVISREARGSFRDAEGLLDQLSSYSDGPVTAAMVRELLGGVGSEVLFETTAALYERRAADALKVVDRLSNEGKDLGRFASELISHLRRLMLLPDAPEVALSEIGSEERGSLEEQAREIPTAEVVRLIEALGDTSGRMRRGAEPKLELELAFLKLARDYTEPSVENLLRRLEALEAAAANGSLRSGSIENTGGPEAAEDPEGDEPEEILAPEKESEATEPVGSDEERNKDVNSVAAQWDRVIEDLRERRQALTATVFQEGWPAGLEDDVLKIVFPKDSDFYVKEAEKPRHRDALGEVLEEQFGIKPRIECRVADAGREDGKATEAKAPPRSHGAPDAAGPEPKEPEEAVSRQAENQGESRATGEDGIIRDQHEVFGMARRHFGLADPKPEHYSNENTR